MTPPDLAEGLKGLPEGVWTYRRIFVFSLTIGAMLLVYKIVDLARPEDLPGIAKMLIWLVMLLAVLYIAGPIAEHIVRLFGLAKVLVNAILPWRKGMTP